MSRFTDALARKNTRCPPIWFMRQAGRYHAHYRALKCEHSFMELCKRPELACEVTMGPIRDFDFDAAILFSDLLFPLEVMGMGLSYDPAPKLGWHLRNREDLAKLKGGAGLANALMFQAEALKRIRKELDPGKGLIGFVGGPLTLYSYAVEGSHQGGLGDAKAGLEDGRYEGFLAKLNDLLVANMSLQAKGGAEAVALFDTCAGEFSPEVYARYAAPALKDVIVRFKRADPATPVIYYSRGTGPEHWRALEGASIDCLGVDWRHDLAEVIERWSDRYAIQGNIDPEWLHLPKAELEARASKVFASVKALPHEKRRGWVCGLGHGVLQHTPEENVRALIALQRRFFEEEDA